MLPLLLKGLLLGLTLSFVVGPLFFSIIESALARGFKAGIAVASGIWTSDILFIGVMLKGIHWLESITALPGFRFWTGIFGSLILVSFGAASLWVAQKKPSVHANATPLLQIERRDFWSQWGKGFMINMVNPGTLLFWIGTATGLVAPNGWSISEGLLFFTAMMAVLVMTDLLKIYAAKKLRNWLTPSHIVSVRKTIGVVLILFGLVVAASNL